MLFQHTDTAFGAQRINRNGANVVAVTLFTCRVFKLAVKHCITSHQHYFVDIHFIVNKTRYTTI